MANITPDHLGDYELAHSDSLVAQVRAAREACVMVGTNPGPVFPLPAVYFDAAEWDHRVAAALKRRAYHGTTWDDVLRILRGEAP